MHRAWYSVYNGAKIIMKSDIVIYIHKFNNGVTQTLRKENCEKTKEEKKYLHNISKKERKKFFQSQNQLDLFLLYCNSSLYNFLLPFLKFIVELSKFINHLCRIHWMVCFQSFFLFLSSVNTFFGSIVLVLSKSRCCFCYDLFFRYHSRDLLGSEYVFGNYFKWL